MIHPLSCVHILATTFHLKSNKQVTDRGMCWTWISCRPSCSLSDALINANKALLWRLQEQGVELHEVERCSSQGKNT